MGLPSARAWPSTGGCALPQAPPVQYRQLLSIACVCLVLPQQSWDTCTRALQTPSFLGRGVG